ncbi:hypothetical protein OF364_00860 [Mycoplasma enhydrae]|uniref:hypothetical protein n=1 Tax=Mycoplasma enhydrae TaxID=2499220 RepID=UPI00197CAE08|nr:hypothetical protein [Mycoplasma enhydrae]MBN4089504.1 hypothetical protein [Mycoplasma enhydrae]MCV3733651.1 hypothetical protein [Mycoplasma enhydrae]MCV3753368.1 hypothetical protein [Mycoplasma enhydrae]
MASRKYKELISLRPFVSSVLQGCLGNRPKNLTDQQIKAKDLRNNNSELEKEFSIKMSNFKDLKKQKEIIDKNYKTLLLNAINNLQSIDKSILLTIIFKRNLSNISWKTFNISKSTFYRKIKFIEKILKWCFFE